MTASPQSLTTQVAPNHYRPSHYDEFHRWVSYWYQIQSVARAQPRTILEIGVGSGVLSAYLRDRLQAQVTTFDFDPSLNPDLVGDVRQLASHVTPESFEAVLAFQVLEHLPFEDFKPALQQLAHASRKNVILSLPHYGYPLQMRFRLWRFNWAFGRKLSKKPRWTFDGEHHWEIGTRDYPLSRIRSEIQTVLQIERDYFCADYPYHYFFECKKPEQS